MDDGARNPQPPERTSIPERTFVENAGGSQATAGLLTVRWREEGRLREADFESAVTIGREASCGIRLSDSTVSRLHAELFPRNGRWHVRDLDSGNGTHLDDVRVVDAVLPRRATLQVGLNVRLAVESRNAPEDASEETLARRYFSPDKPGEGSALKGGRTEMLRNAFRRVDREQKRRYRSIITVIALALLASGAVAVHQYRTLQQSRALATDIFYAMKSVEVQVAALEERIRETGDAVLLDEVSQRRREVRELEARYDRFLEELDLLGPDLSPEDRLILRVTRLFGECELAMPDDFVSEVKHYIHEWRLSPRLRTSIERMHALELTELAGRAMLDRNLPPQYVYVALQESSFDPDAVGPRTRFGIAKGIWQFIPSTARRYGLRTGPLVELPVPDPNDDRHHPEKATRAAADYLHDIYAKDAQASGLLVMASYNWGPNNVRRRIREMPENPRDRNFWKLLQTGDVPRETYRYVFHILSAAVIGEDPGLFGFDFENPLSAFGTVGAPGGLEGPPE